ncbi:Na+/H+ antiporter subunit C [Ancylobacter sp. FA202]|uniref:Na+/H+ antiporter subunit C n=1 Tax=Ancylobacter sp. FA202 TaxID=1111106 RepID=UPI0003779067|nr:Na+/H+ antiporter subunit C [Ancylobacter sp. FA202]
MEMLVASAIGLMTATGLFLILQGRSFPVIVGLTFLSYAVNAFLFAMGRLTVDRPPIITAGAAYTDPLPQALVLTAIVISFGMTALIVVLGLRGFLETGSDRTDLSLADAAEEHGPAPAGEDARRERDGAARA